MFFGSELLGHLPVSMLLPAAARFYRYQSSCVAIPCDVDCRQTKMSDIESVGQNLRHTKTREVELEYIQTHEGPSAVGINLIVKWVMGIYGFSMLICLVYLGYRGIYSNEDVYDNIAEIIKVAVVPVVTFVIGYYFACERGRD